MCKSFYNPTLISWLQSLNLKCPATGSASQFDVGLHTASQFDIGLNYDDCQSGECKTAICVSLRFLHKLSSPNAFHGVSSISQRFLHVRLFTFAISHQEKLSIIVERDRAITTRLSGTFFPRACLFSCCVIPFTTIATPWHLTLSKTDRYPYSKQTSSSSHINVVKVKVM